MCLTVPAFYVRTQRAQPKPQHPNTYIVRAQIPAHPGIQPRFAHKPMSTARGIEFKYKPSDR